MQTAWPYPIGKHMTRCLQIDFHLLTEYIPTTGTRDVEYGASYELKMCVQKSFCSTVVFFPLDDTNFIIRITDPLTLF